MSEIGKWQDENAGKGEGVSSTAKMLIGAISLVMGIIADYFAMTSRAEIDKNTAEPLRSEQVQ